MKLMLILFLTPPLLAQPHEQQGSFQSHGAPTANILFLGNSYTYFHNMPRVLGKLAQDAKLGMNISWQTSGGITLQQLAAGANITQALKAGPWDWVVLQEQSTRPINEPEKMFAGARILNQQIREQGAKPLFFMTWARAHKPEMIEGLAQAYTAISQELDAQLAPVGRAWQLALKERPGLPLHHTDRSHPNQSGTYLTACVFYAVITSRDPRGLGNGGLNIDAETAAFLQGIAQRAVSGK